jgi:hypothetical protein
MEASTTNVLLDLLKREPTTGRFTSVTDKPVLLPIWEGDELQLRVRLNRLAYVCLAWVDQKGKPFPMYPWTWEKVDWNEVIIHEERTAVDVPATLMFGGHSALSVNGPPGVETLVLLVSAQRPAVSVLSELPKQLSGLPVPEGLPEVSRPFCRTFVRAQSDSLTIPTDCGPGLRPSERSLAALHEAVAQRLASHFDQTVTFSFPNAGPRSSGVSR